MDKKIKSILKQLNDLDTNSLIELQTEIEKELKSRLDSMS